MNLTGWKKIFWILCGAALAAAPLVLSGCGGDSEAQAQLTQQKRIQTFTILNNSFSMIADLEPTVEISDGTTRYVMTANTTVNFTPTDGIPVSVILVTGDAIIERPQAQTITVIQGV